MTLCTTEILATVVYDVTAGKVKCECKSVGTGIIAIVAVPAVGHRATVYTGDLCVHSSCDGYSSCTMRDYSHA